MVSDSAIHLPSSADETLPVPWLIATLIQCWPVAASEITQAIDTDLLGLQSLFSDFSLGQKMFGNKRTSRPKALQAQLCAAGAGVGRGRHSQGLPGTHRPRNLHCWVQRSRTEVDWPFGGF